MKIYALIGVIFLLLSGCIQDTSPCVDENLEDDVVLVESSRSYGQTICKWKYRSEIEAEFMDMDANIEAGQLCDQQQENKDAFESIPIAIDKVTTTDPRCLYYCQYKYWNVTINEEYVKKVYIGDVCKIVNEKRGRIE